MGQSSIGSTYYRYIMPLLISILAASAVSSTVLAADSAAAAQGVKIVAVANLQLTGNPKSVEALSYLGPVMGELLSDSLAATGRLQVVNRSKIAEALSLLGSAPGSAVDDNTAMRLAQELGADSTITGSLNIIGTNLTLSVRAIERDTGGVLTAAQAKGKTEDDLVQMMEMASAALTESLLAAKPIHLPQPKTDAQAKAEAATAPTTAGSTTAAPQTSSDSKSVVPPSTVQGATNPVSKPGLPDIPSTVMAPGEAAQVKGLELRLRYYNISNYPESNSVGINFIMACRNTTAQPVVFRIPARCLSAVDNRGRTLPVAIRIREGWNNPYTNVEIPRGTLNLPSEPRRGVESKNDESYNETDIIQALDVGTDIKDLFISVDLSDDSIDYVILTANIAPFSNASWKIPITVQ